MAGSESPQADGPRVTRTKTVDVISLGDGEYRLEQRPDGVSEITLADDEAVLETLAKRFGLPFPAGTRFAYK